jgi:TusA-related sulfurtransferase
MVEVEEVLDLRDEECPGPVVKTLKKLAEMPDGGKLVVLLTSEPCAIILISNLAAARIGRAEVERQGRVIKMTITKTSSGKKG